jgi:hypothetical protein
MSEESKADASSNARSSDQQSKPIVKRETEATHYKSRDLAQGISLQSSGSHESNPFVDQQPVAQQTQSDTTSDSAQTGSSEESAKD